MDARCVLRVRSLPLAVLFSLVLAAAPAWAGSARTRNFIVTASTQELANEIATAAENFRRDLAIEWLGKELADWEQPCPIRATVDPRLGAGGATSFMFASPGRNTPGRPHGWTMSIQGSRERVLDSVLPHEVTHTIFATHFGRPLPRWADEGACTTVEDISERSKQEKLLYQFLTTNRGIAFNKMFAMKEYPQDILPLYSQGYALARYFIALGGKQKFVAYVGAGMDSGDWTAATKKFYGFRNLSDLQLSWVEWVKRGTPEIQDAGEVLYVSTDPAVNGRTLAEVNGVATPKTQLASLERSTEASSEANRPAAEATRVALIPAVGVGKFSPLKNSPAVPENRLPAKEVGNDSSKTATPPANRLPPATHTGKSQPTAGAGGWYARLHSESNSGLSDPVQERNRVAALPGPGTE